MKNYKLITSILLLAFVFGCSGSSTYEETDYTLPELKYQPRMLYPSEAKGKDLSGVSKVYLYISESGEVEKVTLLQSSGFDVLDDAALNYCKQMVFKPANKDGESVKSRMVQSINFNQLDKDYSFDNYIVQVKKLYRYEKNASDEEKGQFQDRILRQHDQFVQKMSNTVSFNSVLKKVVKFGSCSDWDDCWNGWPLTFLLYHDFIQRYPGYANIDDVKDRLQKAVQSDIELIVNTPSEDPGDQKEKMDLIAKIKKFIRNNYPEIPVDDYPLTAKMIL